MNQKILKTMYLSFYLKQLIKNEFVLIAPLPEFIKTKDTDGKLDIDVKVSRMPKDYVFSFYIAKDSSSLANGNFHSLCYIGEDIQITQSISFNKEKPFLLDKKLLPFEYNSSLCVPTDLISYLKTLFEQRH